MMITNQILIVSRSRAFSHSVVFQKMQLHLHFFNPKGLHTLSIVPVVVYFNPDVSPGNILWTLKKNPKLSGLLQAAPLLTVRDLNKKNFSTKCTTRTTHFITGFSDAEGCFMIPIVKSNRCKLGFQVQAKFQICLHEKDLQLLSMIQSNLGVGSIIKGKGTAIYCVANLKEITDVLIQHFEKYPLMTQKRADYELFKQAVKFVQNKEHLTIEGLRKILSVKATMNNGLSDSLNAAFPGTTPVPRPLVIGKEVEPNWLAGFVEGEGCFFVNVRKSRSHILGETVALRFKITQHTRDAILMENILNFFGCGSCHKNSSGTIIVFSVERLVDLTEKIIPFFDRHPLKGSKAKDYEDFKKVVELVRCGAHLTALGLNKIRKMKSGMNYFRSQD